ncbi:hypothetical protein [Sphingomonas sp.]|uniref:hypothetical protein n=1 Tax=Sphingomonas sp. TaxID=28214 RepID=UPI001B014D0F|nr:hypothetical protein [Sphingomonas sp.]MBO9711365.1 hypothetical protein [Sphingomonas sp.]
MEQRGDPAWLFWLSFAGLLALLAGMVAAAPMLARMMPQEQVQVPEPVPAPPVPEGEQIPLSTPFDRVVLTQAPHTELARYRDAEIALVERLQTASIPDCASYVTERPSDPIFEDAEATKRLEALQAQYRIAIAAGHDHPAQRRFGAVDGPDATAFDEAMLAEGMSDRDLAFLNRIDGMPPARQCDLGLKRLRALRRLPEAVGDHVYASLLMGNI